MFQLYRSKVSLRLKFPKKQKPFRIYNNTACIKDRNKALAIRGFKTKEKYIHLTHGVILN